jgi:hypothetical protein
MSEPLLLPRSVAEDLESIVALAKDRVRCGLFGVPVWVIRAWVRAAYVDGDRVTAIAIAQFGDGPWSPAIAETVGQWHAALEALRLNLPVRE